MAYADSIDNLNLVTPLPRMIHDLRSDVPPPGIDEDDEIADENEIPH